MKEANARVKKCEERMQKVKRPRAHYLEESKVDKAAKKALKLISFRKQKKKTKIKVKYKKANK